MIDWQYLGRRGYVSPTGRFDVFQSQADQQFVCIDWDHGLNRRFPTEEEAKAWAVEQQNRKPSVTLRAAA